MELDHRTAAAIAGLYFDTSVPLVRLGWGISGYVYLSPDLRTAVKVHRHHESYVRELEVYRRLSQLRITRLHGLSIPKLRAYRDELNLIQMDFVSAPYLLDFAGVQFAEPDFSPDVMADWHTKIADFYGPNASIAYDVYNSLARHGMFYMDFRPSNLKLADPPETHEDRSG
jgi:hypothetical protein